jgi:hypothetical protein
VYEIWCYHRPFQVPLSHGRNGLCVTTSTRTTSSNFVLMSGLCVFKRKFSVERHSILSEWWNSSPGKSSGWPSVDSQNVPYSPVFRLVKEENIKVAETSLEPKHLLHRDSKEVCSQLQVNQYSSSSKSTSVSFSYEMLDIAYLTLF